MIQLWYYTHLHRRQRPQALLAATAFVILEPVALMLRSTHVLLAGFIGMLGTFVLGLQLGRDPRLWRVPLRTLSYPDWLVYIALIVATISLPFFAAGDVPRGLLLPRVDLELFLFGLVVLIVAIIFPSVNDTYRFNRQKNKAGIRRVEYLRQIPFGWRRCLTACCALVTLGFVVASSLLYSDGLSKSAFLIGVFGCLVAPVFERAYGFSSTIMRVFGTSLFLTIALALMLRTEWSRAHPPTIIVAIVLIGACAYAWARAVYLI